MKKQKKKEQEENYLLLFTSDFMEKEILIPQGVEADVDGFKIFIKGSKGYLNKDLFSPVFRDLITIKKHDNKIIISYNSEKRKIKSMVGTIASHINNMIKGVTDGYSCRLKIIYMHFPITIKVSGNEVFISNFLGEKFPRKANIVGQTKVDVHDDIITVSGISKEDVFQTAANIERATWIKARDRRVFQDGIFLLSE